MPGALECPLALQRLLERNDVDGAVLLGICRKAKSSQKYGCWAEYRGNRKGLLLALLQ